MLRLQSSSLPMAQTNTQGVKYDALRTEVTSLSAAHEVTGWIDEEYVNAGTEERANDAVANNNR